MIPHGNGEGVGAVELYRVLLVDDEEDIRVGISRKIDWEGLGYALVGEADCGHLRWEIRPADRVGERAVDRHQNGTDVVIGEHHRHVHRAASVCEDFRVAGVGKPGLSQCFLVDWCRDNSSDRT